jgi:hypothetical protein
MFLRVLQLTVQIQPKGEIQKVVWNENWARAESASEHAGKQRRTAYIAADM